MIWTIEYRQFGIPVVIRCVCLCKKCDGGDNENCLRAFGDKCWEPIELKELLQHVRVWNKIQEEPTNLIYMELIEKNDKGEGEGNFIRFKLVGDMIPAHITFQHMSSSK